jgi:quercetin dioxygenase-like cupin family protein
MSDPSRKDGPDAAAALVFEKIASALEPTEVSQTRRMTMRRRIRELVASRLPAGMTTLRATDGEWISISALTQMKLLRVDPAGGTQTVLIRAAPGGILPRHRHGKDEEFIVLEGECRIGAQRLVAGDAHFASAGSWHEDITTETGVLVLLRGEYPAPAHA